LRWLLADRLMEDPINHAGNWVTDPQGAVDIETREVYALAGLALYQAQCLEHEIVNSLGSAAIVRMLRTKFPVTSSEVTEYRSQVDRVWDENYERTLGQLLDSLRRSGISIPDGLASALRQSLETRNRLVHAYFRERAEAWFDSDGRRSMAEELRAMQEQFKKTDQALHDATSKIRNALGITEEKIDLVGELMKTGASDGEIARAISKPARGNRS